MTAQAEVFDENHVINTVTELVVELAAESLNNQVSALFSIHYLPLFM